MRQHHPRTFTPRRQPQPAPLVASGYQPTPAVDEAVSAITAAGAETAAWVLGELDASASLDRLRASARARSEAAFQAVLDQPDRRGGIRWPDGDDGNPERIPEDEHPLDLAGETQRRRERARWNGPKNADESAIVHVQPGDLVAAGSLRALMLEVEAREAGWRRQPV